VEASGIWSSQRGQKKTQNIAMAHTEEFLFNILAASGFNI
jgi:hypothetical protein